MSREASAESLLMRGAVSQSDVSAAAYDFQRAHDADLQLDASRREVLRLSTQLSAVKDECESLERKIIRLEALHNTAVSEMEEKEDANRRLRREVDDLRRKNNELSSVRCELVATRDSMQKDLQDVLATSARLQAELELRADQQAAQQAVFENAQKQHEVIVAHNSLLQEQRKKLEDDVRRLTDDTHVAHKMLEAAKRSTLEECDMIAAIVERNVMHAHSSWTSPNAEDDLMSLVKFVGVDMHHESSRNPAVFRDGSLNVSVYEESLNGSAQSTHRPAAIDVKPLFTSLYQAAKSLRQFFTALRSERKSAVDALEAVKASCQSAERELQQSLAECRHLQQRASHSEVIVTRLTSQLDAAKRQQEETASSHAALMSFLQDTLKPATLDVTSIETQCRLVCSERDQLKDRVRSLLDVVAGLKAEVVAARQDGEDRLAELQRDSQLALKQDASIFTQRLAACNEEKQRLVRELDALKDHSSATTASLQAELDVAKQQRNVAQQAVERLQPTLRALQADVPALENRIRAKEEELQDARDKLHTFQQRMHLKFEALRKRLGPYHSNILDAPDDDALGAALESRSTPKFCSLFELLIISLRALHGCRREMRDMVWQRQSLSRYLFELERTFGPLSAQLVPTRGLRRLLRLRAAVVAVLAANRLFSFVRQRCWMRESVVSARRSFGKVRMPLDVNVIVEGGVVGINHPSITKTGSGSHRHAVDARVVREESFFIPSAVEAEDIPALLATLLEQVKSTTTSVPSSAWAHVAPPLVLHLQSSLQRMYMMHGRLSSQHGYATSAAIASPQRPSVVYPHVHQVAAAQGAAPVLASAMAAQQHVLRSAMKGAGPSIVFPSPYPAPTHASHQYTPAPLGETPHIVNASSFSGATPIRSYTTQNNSLQHSTAGAVRGTDEFASEVLNVIRALDNKVAGALRLPHHQPQQSPRSAGSHRHRR